MADQDRTFDPSKVQVNRGHDRKPGVGQRKLDAQRDPGADAAALAGDNPEEDWPEEDWPEEDWGDPVEGAAYSANHATRGVKTDAERGPGPKTRQATKDQISRR